MTQRQVVYVPKYGFLPGMARELLHIDAERYARLSRNLLYGEWIMHQGRERITMAGMQALARAAGVDLDFRPEAALMKGVRPSSHSFIEASLPERDRD